ncbi:MAG: hypothetical protein IJT58_05055 [Synergistaceae bacterium]|nr:hypothetical protein [Synergistaceae bacterium]
MQTLWEIIIDGVKKFGGEIIAAVLLALFMWLYRVIKKTVKRLYRERVRCRGSTSNSAAAGTFQTGERETQS